MKIDRSSWHYRYLRIITEERDMPHSMCVYIYMLIMTSIFLPFLLTILVVFSPVWGIFLLGYWLDTTKFGKWVNSLEFPQICSSVEYVDKEAQ